MAVFRSIGTTLVDSNGTAASFLFSPIPLALDAPRVEQWLAISPLVSFDTLELRGPDFLEIAAGLLT